MTQLLEVGGHRFAVLAADGPRIDSEQSALDVIGEAWGEEADMIVIPKARLTPEFFVLSTRLLGLVAQKFVNYNIRAGIVGDFSRELADSKPLGDFFYETNQGGMLVFADDLDDLAKKLSA